ncbi:AraC family transcriptional regulator [Nonomuraea monospora]|uniref:AraC family transcriptional regulator n=1 Tax=Nonomuraea monospora TaxID=568818 RepID=A0ABN3CSD3_9ACTN
MDDVIERAVMRVIDDIQQNFGEQLTIDDMAHTAMFSKFHFSRVFQRVTGLSPGRFLSAVRLREAKRLLASTSLNIAYISHQVGYSSVGTFSSRFTRSVGLSPSRYRQVLGVPRMSLAGGASRSRGGGTATVHGTVTSPLPDRPVFAGMFVGQLLEGKPASYTVLSRPGPFVMDDVPAGHWYLLAQSVADGCDDAVNLPPASDVSLCVARRGPIAVGAGGGSHRADLALRPMGSFDPPHLLALGDVLAAWQEDDGWKREDTG